MVEGGSPLQRILAVAKEALDPTDEDLLAVNYVAAVAASHYIPMSVDPVWGWLIGPPGSMKTEILRSFQGADGALMLSSMTPNTLVSGYDREDGVDPSLLPKMNGKVVVIKEFSSILELPEPQVRTIFGQLRDVYDGSHSKSFGTVGIRSHEAVFSLLAAVTPIIDSYALIHASLGERFVGFRIARKPLAGHPARLREMRHVWESSETKKVWRATLRNEFNLALAYFSAHRCVPEVPPAIIENVIQLANLLAFFRSISKDGIWKPPEKGNRAQQQLRGLLCGHALAAGRTRVDDSDLALAQRVALDSLPAVVADVVTLIHRHTTNHTSFLPLNDIHDETKCGLAWLGNVLHQYSRNGLVLLQGNTVRIEDETLKQLNECGFTKGHARY